MIVNNLTFQRSDVQLFHIITNELNDEMLHVLCDYPAFSSHINNKLITCLTSLYPGQPRWAVTRRNIHSLTLSLWLLYNIFN